MRSNHSREERQKIVEEYMQSGKPQTVFAPENGIKPNTLSAWVTKYRTAKQNGISPEDYLRCLFEKAPYAETKEDWEKLLPWNIEITPYKIRGEWM